MNKPPTSRRSYCTLSACLKLNNFASPTVGRLCLQLDQKWSHGLLRDRWGPVGSGPVVPAVVFPSFPCRFIAGCCYGWYDQIVWFLEVCFVNCSIRHQGGTTLATSAPTTNTSARLDMDTCANAHQCFTEATPINAQCCAGIIGSALL